MLFSVLCRHQHNLRTMSEIYSIEELKKMKVNTRLVHFRTVRHHSHQNVIMQMFTLDSFSKTDSA